MQFSFLVRKTSEMERSKYFAWGAPPTTPLHVNEIESGEREEEENSQTLLDSFPCPFLALLGLIKFVFIIYSVP